MLDYASHPLPCNPGVFGLLHEVGRLSSNIDSNDKAGRGILKSAFDFINCFSKAHVGQLFCPERSIKPTAVFNITLLFVLLRCYTSRTFPSSTPHCRPDSIRYRRLCKCGYSARCIWRKFARTRSTPSSTPYSSSSSRNTKRSARSAPKSSLSRPCLVYLQAVPPSPISCINRSSIRHFRTQKPICTLMSIFPVLLRANSPCFESRTMCPCAAGVV